MDDCSGPGLPQSQFSPHFLSQLILRNFVRNVIHCFSNQTKSNKNHQQSIRNFDNSYPCSCIAFKIKQNQRKTNSNPSEISPKYKTYLAEISIGLLLHIRSSKNSTIVVFRIRNLLFA